MDCPTADHDRNIALQSSVGRPVDGRTPSDVTWDRSMGDDPGGQGYPQASSMLAEAGPDVMTFTAFPELRWRQI